MEKILRGIEIVVGIVLILAGLLCVAWDGSMIYGSAKFIDSSFLKSSFAPAIGMVISELVSSLGGSDMAAQFSAVVIMFGIWFGPFIIGWDILKNGFPHHREQMLTKPSIDLPRSINSHYQERR